MELNQEQQEAVNYHGPAQNILVKAGAGCGKTRTIIARAIFLVRSGLSASRILMVTFTNRAAREMKTRLKRELGSIADEITIGTFHHFCFTLLKKMPKSFDLLDQTIIDLDDQVDLMGIVRGRHLDHQEKNLKKNFPRANKLVELYSFSRNTCQSPIEYLLQQSDLDNQYCEIATQIFDEYQKEKGFRGYLDFDDLLDHFCNSLEKKIELKRAITSLFHEILVDEMQDTNPLQFRILKHFVSEQVRLFCVGDPAQSIYRFRGAEFKLIYNFEKIFKNTSTITLSLNYRSYQEILDLSNWLLERSPFDYNTSLRSKRQSGAIQPLMYKFKDTAREAEWIVRQIMQKHEENVSLNSNMILVRTSLDAKPIELELLYRKIPYSFVGGLSLTKAAHVRDVFSLLRIIRNPIDELAWMRFLKLWPRVGERTASRIIDQFHKDPETHPIETVIKKLGKDHEAVIAYQKGNIDQRETGKSLKMIIELMNPLLREKYDKWKSRSNDLKLLISAAQKYPCIGDFIDAFTLEPLNSSQIEAFDGDEAVLLITVHSAKGIEAPNCFIAGAKPGSYPHVRSLGNIDSEEEERRILYVAMTRAQNELYITGSLDRGQYFHSTSRTAKGDSFFLERVPNRLLMQKQDRKFVKSTQFLREIDDIY